MCGDGARGAKVLEGAAGGKAAESAWVGLRGRKKEKSGEAGLVGLAVA